MKRFLLVFSLLVFRAAAAPDLAATAEYVIDGDTFGAIIDLGAGAKVSARVRFMDIDAPELHGECESEIELANRSKDRLAELLPAGTGVVLSGIKDDKYLGRIDAYVKFPDGRDVGRIMTDEKLARAYGGGRRLPWCAPEEIERYKKGVKND